MQRASQIVSQRLVLWDIKVVGVLLVRNKMGNTSLSASNHWVEAVRLVATHGNGDVFTDTLDVTDPVGHVAESSS